MSNPFEKTVLLNVTIHQLGTTRKVNTDQVEVDADKDLLRLSKKLFECEEYKVIVSISSELKAYLRKKSVPAQLLKSGIFPIPVTSVSEVDEKIQELRSRFNSAVDAFMAVYEERIEESLSKLRVLGQRADYPLASQARQAFSLEWAYVEMGPPSSLKEISKALFAREKEKAEAQWRVAAEEVRESLRFMFRELSDHMLERLTPTADGKAKQFKESMIRNFKEFLTDFPARNITNDAELGELVDKARNLLAGVRPEELRRNTATRESVKQQVTCLQQAVDTLLQDAPLRKITLESA